MPKNLRFYDLHRKGTLKQYWLPETLSDLIYIIRYWIGYFIIPSNYKMTINDYNEIGWRLIFEQQEKEAQKTRSRKHLKIVKSPKPTNKE